MKLENQAILIISNEPWGDTWYSKHNYAWELSKKNKVIFINPPEKFNPFNIFKKNIHQKNITKSLDVVTYKNVLPVKFEFLRLVNERFIFNELKKYLRKNYNQQPIFWSFDPIRLTIPEVLNPKKIILHAVDEYLFTYPAEKIISKKADIIIAVAKEIGKNYTNYNQNTHIVHHAIPTDEFINEKSKINNQLQGIYVGNIDKRIDFDYTSYIIEKFPNITFHFVGKITIANDAVNMDIFTGKFKNIVYHGEQPYKKLKEYIHSSDFCFVFKDIKYPGNNISSHKMLQYFAQGKPIFTTKMYRYKEIEELLYMENEKEKMVERIENFILKGEAEELKRKRIEYAKTFSFEHTLLNIEQLLGDE
ncbi:MAG: hypothetical protein JNL69_03190 [Bacteroidia bacterium]|nr:hypothetical protein [Bacteroidia bacterium]